MSLRDVQDVTSAVRKTAAAAAQRRALSEALRPPSDPTQELPDPEAFCRCGHYEREHDGRCAVTEPDRCGCRGFRYGARSKHR